MAEYRKVIVGLIFLRYISGAFKRRYEELVAEGDGFENDRDAYAEDKRVLGDVVDLFTNMDMGNTKDNYCLSEK